MPSPQPELTPARIDAMLSRMAEACMEGLEEARERMAGAADDAAFERASRAMGGFCRNVRQTIALKQRFDREQVGLARERQRDVEVAETAAQRAHENAVAHHRTQVRRHFERVLWNEYDEDEAQDIFEEVDAVSSALPTRTASWTSPSRP